MTDAKMMILRASVIRGLDKTEGKPDVYAEFKYCNIKATINSCWARNSSAPRNVQRGRLVRPTYLKTY